MTANFTANRRSIIWNGPCAGVNSVSHLTALDAPPEEFIPLAAAAGFSGVGLRVLPSPLAPRQYPVAGDRKRTRALRRIADDVGIRIMESEAFGLGPDSDPASMEAGLETAAELGATFVVSAGIDHDEARLSARYAQLGELANQFGLTVVIEFMPARPMASLQHALRVLDRADNANLKLLIDVLHLFRSGGSVSDIEALDPALIGYIHLSDAPSEHPGQEGLTPEMVSGRLYPGQGALPLRELFSVLPRGIPVSLEAPHRDEADLLPAARLMRAGSATLSFMASVR